MADDRHDGAPEVDPFAMTCAELVELVTDYIEGDLDADERSLIDAHLSVCPPCVHVIDQWRRVIALTGRIDEAHADQLPADQRARLVAAFRDAAPPG